MTTPRTGILAAGNFILDHVKIVDHYPQPDMLANIVRESSSNGGGPYNVLKDLAAMQVKYPLSACGLVGEDANGRWIRQDCLDHGIDTRQLHATSLRATSYTDAMTVQATGRRTFFHQRGANALFDSSHLDVSNTNARILHLAYLMLLDQLDTIDHEGRSRAADLLATARAAGLITSVDMVSTEHPTFREIALSALPFTDHLIVNELEAARVLGLSLPADDPARLSDAAKQLLEAGVRGSATIHTEFGAVSASADGENGVQPSLNLPVGYSQGATGAGDAFAAGLLHGLHENLSLAERLHLAVCTAAASLSHPTPSQGLRPMGECLALASQFGYASFRSSPRGPQRSILTI